MRKLILIPAAPLAAVALLAFAAGCKRNLKKVDVQATDENAPELATMIHVADPRAALQLVKGFHDIEGNAWRWTMGKFTVTLRPPAGAAQKGATLLLKLAVPEPVIQRLKAVTLRATVQGVPLKPETYGKSGDYTYTRDVPPKAMAGEAATVDFTLDKFIAAGEVERRELGVVVSSVGFEAK